MTLYTHLVCTEICYQFQENSITEDEESEEDEVEIATNKDDNWAFRRQDNL